MTSGLCLCFSLFFPGLPVCLIYLFVLCLHLLLVSFFCHIWLKSWNEKGIYSQQLFYLQSSKLHKTLWILKIKKHERNNQLNLPIAKQRVTENKRSIYKTKPINETSNRCKHNQSMRNQGNETNRLTWKKQTKTHITLTTGFCKGIFSVKLLWNMFIAKGAIEIK